VLVVKVVLLLLLLLLLLQLLLHIDEKDFANASSSC
jgi:hypothetical protein